MTADIFLSLPTSVVANSLCLFLSSDDLLALRATCSSMYKTFHEQGGDSELIWKNALKVDFHITDDHGLQTLQYRKMEVLSAKPLPIFGYPATEAIVVARNAFECWKKWRKACLVFDRPVVDGQANEMNGPYFLRAARLWSKIERWLDSPQSKDVGPLIRRTLLRGRHGHEWPRAECFGCLDALQVLYAFYGGQAAFDLHRGLEGMFSGLMGGWNAYNVYSCTSLKAPETHLSVDLAQFVQFATTTILANHLIMCRILVDWFSGDMFLQAAGSDRVKMCGGFDAVLSWMELHAGRLDQGLIGVGPMGRDPRDHSAIVLYPRPPHNSPPTVGVQAASRAVTRGVEVVASAIYSPLLAANGMGFIYSFRIRLLTPEDGDEYVSPEDRGFETCKLGSRHWQIIDDETGRTDHVDGDGVIGMHPVLFEGGYTESVRADGPFVYQSCTGQMKKGRFQGHLTFVSGKVDYSPHPTGRFDVTVAPFLLDSEPKYLY